MLTSAATHPAIPTPPEEIAAALERISALADLDSADRLWLARHGEELIAEAGTVLFEEGAPAERMILILKGEIHVRRQQAGPMALFVGRAGQMTGLLPFSRMTSYGGQGLTMTPVWALLIHKSLFRAMLEAIPSMAQRVVGVLLDRVREVTRIEQQAEKLNALGKLAANLAHELNNPASAARRASAGLAEELKAIRANRFRLVRLCLSPAQIEGIEAWDAAMLARSPRGSVNAAEAIRREESIRAWLEASGCGQVWEVAPQLAEQGITVTDLEELQGFLPPEAVDVTLRFFARSLRSARLVETMAGSTARIFELISAIQTYSSMDRAPLQEIDLPAALDATLEMFRSRLQGVRVECDYQLNLPRISVYASELNQVWAALIENALDALAGSGCLRICCRLETGMLLVEIQDSGPGIPAELQGRIFEPFFTTKAPGQALGLGLDNAMRIVRVHRGHLGVRSEPGATCFRVRLPLDQLQAY
jgi:signal transduction histidine kinase